MLRLTTVRAEAPTAEELAGAPRLRLTHEERVRSRLATVLADGTAVAILLPRGSLLRDGTVLAGDDGALAVVEAAPQPVARIAAASALDLLRATYHLANRHVPVQLAVDHLLIEPDPVLERMLAALGARIEHLDAPFDPEAGADHAHGAHAHGVDAEDVAAGAIGEALSIAAHRAERRGRPDSADEPQGVEALTPPPQPSPAAQGRGLLPPPPAGEGWGGGVGAATRPAQS
ncbi:MAG: urease accessory protein UreE [Burkholderiales bacterium]|jgi:urease accessory protein|nr:urease accessory protein UreE [Burkholderiales bacterium]